MALNAKTCRAGRRPCVSTADSFPLGAILSGVGDTPVELLILVKVL